MPDEPSTVPEREESIEDVILSYLQAVDAGEYPSPEEFIAGHPAHAEELREYFAAQGVLDPLLAPLRRVGAAARKPPQLPEEFAASYEVQDWGAGGGMGEIRPGRDNRPNPTVAIKVLREEYRGRADVERRFLEEAQITAQLQHPGIVPIHEIGRLADGSPFFGMKLIKGRTLANLLKQRLSPAD